MPVLSIHLQLIIIAIAAIGFDLGLQASLVAHQTLVYGLDPEARGRLNGVLFAGVFIGMALGSWLGNIMFVYGGWMFVVTLACISAILSLLIRLYEGCRLAQQKS